MIPRANARLINGGTLYFLVLVPLLTAALVTVRAIRSLVNLTTSQYVIVMCASFIALSVVCLVFGILNGHDLIVSAQQKNDSLLAVCLVFIAICFLMYLSLLAIQCTQQRDFGSFVELFASSFASYHFYIVVWRRTMIDGKPFRMTLLLFLSQRQQTTPESFNHFALAVFFILLFCV